MRKLLAALILAGALAVPGAGVAIAASGTAPGVSLSGDANASPLEVTMTAGSFAKGQLIDGRYPHAQADVASGDQATAHGSILDAGALVQTLPYEVAANCPPPSPFPQQPPPGGCPQFPGWPFGADADGAHPDVSGNVAAQTAGPFSFGTGQYSLHVVPGSANATATGGRGTLAAVQSLTITSGSAEASVVTQGSEATSRVSESLHGVVIAGVVDIAAITSTSEVRTEAGARGVASGRLVLTGVTVAGQAASIDGSGIHLLGQTAPLPLDPAQQALDQLAQAGINVRLLGPDQQSSTGYAAYSGSAVQVALVSPQDGSGFSALLGPAQASAVAVPFQSLNPAAIGFGTSSATPALTSTSLPGAAPPSAAPAAGGTARVIRLLGLTVTPKALLLALLGLVELSLLGAGAIVLWPARTPAPAPTLRPLG